CAVSVPFCRADSKQSAAREKSFFWKRATPRSKFFDGERPQAAAAAITAIKRNLLVCLMWNVTKTGSHLIVAWDLRNKNDGMGHSTAVDGLYGLPTGVCRQANLSHSAVDGGSRLPAP